ncbi:MAG: hypothetical protein R3C32_06725 [Chloroflexota bacterium]
MTPSPVNPLGVKGVGEAGTYRQHAHVVNAVMDAVATGHPTADMPLTDQVVRRAMQQAGEVRSASRRRSRTRDRPRSERPSSLLAGATEGTKVINGGQSLQAAAQAPDGGVS